MADIWAPAKGGLLGGTLRLVTHDERLPESL